MRTMLLGAALMALLASPANADPKDDAMAVIDRWAKAFAASDVDGITALYSPDALFLGTGSKTVATTPEEIRSYFENALLNNRPRGASLSDSTTMVLSDGAVIVTGLDATTGVRDSQPFSNPGRITFAVARRGSDWKIAHFHRSAMPR
jgi:uncharacterized protein (TIGR02246 family)